MRAVPGRSDLGDEHATERRDLGLGLGHERGQAAPDRRTMRHGVEPERMAQRRIAFEQAAQLRIAEGAERDGDGGKQEEGLSRVVARPAALGRVGRRRLVVGVELMN